MGLAGGEVRAGRGAEKMGGDSLVMWQLPPNYVFPAIRPRASIASGKGPVPFHPVPAEGPQDTQHMHPSSQIKTKSNFSRYRRHAANNSTRE